MAEGERQPKTIRQLRQERGWSHEQVARQVGVDQASVSKWEHGTRKPYPRRLRRLAALFGVSVETIAFGPAEQP